MKRNPAAIRIPAAALLAIFSLAAFPTAGMAGEDAQAEWESRRIEAEARRQQEMARREMEGRERAQAEALRGQEEAIRRMEATRSRIEANAQQIPPPPVLSAPQAPALPPVFPEARAYPDLARRDDPVSGMSFTPLTEQLGSYFGTRSGVLVVRTRPDAPFGLQDGDVILAIDGRVPVDDQHAAGILRSYRPGERVKLRVQRDRRAIEIDTFAPGQRGN